MTTGTEDKESALETLMKQIPEPKPSVWRHFGEKAKEKTFWDCTQAEIDRFEIEGKRLVVYGSKETYVLRDFGHRQVHILGRNRPWKASFPASVCAVEFIETEPRYIGWGEFEDVLVEKLIVHWPMWLENVQDYGVSTAATLKTVADIKRIREGKVPELQGTVRLMKEVRETTYGPVREVVIEVDGGETIGVSLWGYEQIDQVEVGTTIRITNGWAKDYLTKREIVQGKTQGKLTVSAGKYGKFEVVA